MNALRHLATVLCPLLCIAGLTGCPKDPGNYIWVDDYKDPTQASKDYVIVPGDVLNVRVFQQEQMSARVRVRSDGKVSLPFLNDVVVAGFTPAVLAAQFQARLKDYLNNPVVTVSVEEVRQVAVSVMGEVTRPGVYNLEPGAGVMHALAAAGGFTEYARKDYVFVVRGVDPSGKPTRIRFTYDGASRAIGKAGTFTLQHNDVLVVE